MVIKRQCSFCANEIEPGTGTMFVKRDGSIFHFCSSSCRKQQLHLGRVGHRRKWTRAHAMKKAAGHAAGKSGGPLISSTPSAPAPAAPAPASAEAPEAAPPEPPSAAEPPAAAAPPGETPPKGSSEPPTTKPPPRPRRRSPKAAKSPPADAPPETPPSA